MLSHGTTDITRLLISRRYFECEQPTCEEGVLLEFFSSSLNLLLNELLSKRREYERAIEMQTTFKFHTNNINLPLPRNFDQIS